MKQEVIKIIEQSSEIMETLEACEEYNLPNHYLAGGSITQSVWNHLLGLPLLHNVKDFDVVYFSDEAAEFEHQREVNINGLVNHQFPVDIKNQASVHEWYPQKFGRSITPYSSSEDGIDSWLPAFAIGVRLKHKKMKVYAPYGFEDLLSMLVRPNKKVMSEENYLEMTSRFKKRWPVIVIEPW